MEVQRDPLSRISLPDDTLYYPGPKDTHDACAVSAIINYTGKNAVPDLYELNRRQNHRGPNGTGIAVNNGWEIRRFAGLGMVVEVLRPEILAQFRGAIAIGHDRYATNGSNTRENLQPMGGIRGLDFISHNGNLYDTSTIDDFFDRWGIQKKNLNDSAKIQRLVEYWHQDRRSSFYDAVIETQKLLEGSGSFSVVAMSGDEVAAFRDGHGIRPLSYVETPDGYAVASETCAFAESWMTNYDYQDIKAGEAVFFRGGEPEHYQVVPGNEHLEAFEYVYFASPRSRLQGNLVADVRYRFGQNLAQENPHDKFIADIVVGIPNSGMIAAKGYSDQIGLPLKSGLTINDNLPRHSRSERSFLQATQEARQKMVESKFTVHPEIVDGKDIIIVDDSIVRGTSKTPIIEMLRKAGARKIYARSASAPVRFPNKLGIDTKSIRELVAATSRDNQEIAEKLGANSVAYLSLERMIKAIGVGRDRLCLSDFDGINPIEESQRKPSRSYSYAK